MKCALVLALALALVATGCGGDEDKASSSSSGGLEAKLFDTEADDVLVGSAGVFVLDGADLARIDTSNGETKGNPVSIESSNARVAIGQEMAWVTSEGEAKQVPLSGAPIRELKVPGDQASLVVAEGDRAWILAGRQLMSLMESGDGELIDLPCEPEELTTLDGVVWGTCARGLLRVEAGGARVIGVDGRPRAIAATAGLTWALVKDRLVGVSSAGKRGVGVKAPTGANSLAGQGNTLWVVAGSGDDSKPEAVTRHDGLNGSLSAGPIELPGSTGDVGAVASSLAADPTGDKNNVGVDDGGSLWFTLAFYGGPLGVVESAAN